MFHVKQGPDDISECKWYAGYLFKKNTRVSQAEFLDALKNKYIAMRVLPAQEVLLAVLPLSYNFV